MLLLIPLTASILTHSAYVLLGVVCGATIVAGRGALAHAWHVHQVRRRLRRVLARDRAIAVRTRGER